MSSPGDLIRESTSYVCSIANHVSVDHDAVKQIAGALTKGDLEKIVSPKAFDRDLHYVDGGPLTAQYLLVVDTLNFCFWPESGLEYEHLSKGIKAALLEDRSALVAERLAAITGEGVQSLLGWTRPVPLQEERARLVREVGSELLRSFNGSAAELVAAAKGSAADLVRLVTAHFPGFRDHTIYHGRQIFLYKRAQIFVGDLWGAYEGRGLGEFSDIHTVTMFADYRVPVVLREMQILRYSQALADKVDGKVELGPGSEEEVEIRAATVHSVELLRNELQKLHGQSDSRLVPHSVQLDWWLWEQGELKRDTGVHHRTLTIAY